VVPRRAATPPGRRRANGGLPAVAAAASEPPVFHHRNLPLLLLQAREGVMARFRPVLNAHGVTEQQWRVVRALLEQGPLEPRQIGQVCRLSSPSLAGVLARMDDLGLVQRARMPQDQRRVLVQLTARSRALAQAMAPQIEAAYAAIEAHIGAGFIDGFYRTLDELIALLDSLPADEADTAQPRAVASNSAGC
jgi:homoprotocatechuate degradation regulator HpaR